MTTTTPTTDLATILRARGKFRWAICPTCDGTGKVDHPAFANGISMDEWNGPDWDDDSREGYLSGRYDVPCPLRCEAGKVREPIVEHCSYAERRVLAAQRRSDRIRAEIDAMSAAERRMGA